LHIGNDIVDLGDADSDLRVLHPRFVSRVFTPGEASRIFAADDPKITLWSYWAAKEAAYKALRKAHPGTVFSPSAFVVALATLRGPGCYSGTVSRDGERLALSVDSRRGRVHALAGLGIDPTADSVVVVTEAFRCNRRDQSVAVRALALRGVAAWMSWPHRELRIKGARPPLLYRGPHRSSLDLSLAHHGRWIAYAAARATA